MPLGRRILDSGLHITWADGSHWVRRPEPTSPRGDVWHLSTVCWLSVKTVVPAPPPGCYAAFFRVRKPRAPGPSFLLRSNRDRPLLDFSAEWKVAATAAVSE